MSEPDVLSMREQTTSELHGEHTGFTLGAKASLAQPAEQAEDVHHIFLIY